MNNPEGIGLAAENRIPTGLPFGFIFSELSTEDNMELEIKGYKVLIDDEDYHKISKYTWRPQKASLPSIYFRSYVGSGHKTRKEIYLHRLVNETKKGMYCDHINGNTLDNRKCNLRECTPTGNSRNRRIARNNTTGYTGVTYSQSRKNPFRAEIYLNNKRLDLGLYPTAERAHEAYLEAAKKHFGEFLRDR